MLKRLFKSGSFWFTILAAAMLLAGVCFTIWSWDWLHANASTTVSNSETLRNVGLLIGGGIAFVFALWRSWLAERQADTAQRQADAHPASSIRSVSPSKDSRAPSHDHPCGAFSTNATKQGCSRLGSDEHAVRMDGIDMLERLAREHPPEYHVQVVKRLSLFVRASANLPREPEEGPGCHGGHRIPE